MSTVTDLWNFEAPIESVKLRNGVNLDIARLDLSHPVLSGNKFYKLAKNFTEFQNSDASEVWSMGGVYSNHLHAMAYLGKQLDIPTGAYVRGWLPNESTPTIEDCQRWGMQIVPLSRTEYRTLRIEGIEDASKFFIPEGGNNALGREGARQIYTAASAKNYEQIVLSLGSGTTFRAIAEEKAPEQKLLALTSLKLDYNSFMEELFENHIPPNVSIEPVSRWLGFGKTDRALEQYIDEFLARTEILLDPIYNAKSMYTLENSIQDSLDDSKKSILYIHTGGLQGSLQHRPNFSLY